MTGATASCTTCELGLDHCHALLVEHDDGTTTCVDGCGGPLAVHDDVAACGEVGFGCCEAPVEAERPGPVFQPARAA